MATERRPSRSGKAERTASSSPVPLRPVGSRGGMPAQERALRARGRNTMRRLLDAGVVVFEKRGYQGALVAMIDRFNYSVPSRQVRVDRDEMLDTLATITHMGLFGGRRRPARRPLARGG